MPEGHDTIIEVSNSMSFVLYTQILKQSVLNPASPGITLSCNNFFFRNHDIGIFLFYTMLNVSKFFVQFKRILCIKHIYDL